MNDNINLTGEKFTLLEELAKNGVSIFLFEVRNEEYRVFELITFDPLVESHTAPQNFTTIIGYDITSFICSHQPSQNNSVYSTFVHLKEQSRFNKIKIRISNLHKWMTILNQ